MNATADAPLDVPICKKGGGGPLLPLFGDSEQEWPQELRIVLYLAGLLWCFMGVGIISDVFMTAIEKVTSKKIRVVDSKTKRTRTFELWNPTIANLTLMALGSSAPEILLNVIDIFAKEFFLEGLGPSTIVGSAAFNLLIIIAVCIVSIPDGEVRSIKEMPVYMCTAFWSIFAYIWLIIILLVFSPHVVEIWEGVFTFFFFPLMAVLAFACDKGWIGGGGSRNADPLEDMQDEELAAASEEVRKKHGAHLTDDQVARILMATNAKPRSRARYRVNATRAMFGGRRLSTSPFMNRSASMLGALTKVVPSADPVEDLLESVFKLPVTRLAVLQNSGSVKVTVARTGSDSVPAEVRYRTETGSVHMSRAFEVADGWLKFAPGEMEKEVTIAIHDCAKDGDEEFYLRLVEARGYEDALATVDQTACEAEITIIDIEDGGVLGFECDTDELQVQQQENDFLVKARVHRRQGLSGEVTVKYYTEGDSAIPDRDFVPCEGELVFADGQVEAVIEMTVKGACRFNVSDRFRLVLTQPERGAKLDGNRDGGPDKNILTVTILPDSETQEHIERIRSALNRKWERSKIGHANWASQFKEAITVGDQDGDDPVIRDYVVHAFAMPWKVLFAFVPPTDFCGGWVCFFCALIAIGLVTMVINDMASLLGCVMCIPDEITAITFVALGTSLPDTFASMSAAKSEPHADSSVGNVTGSNSVNVFLGLGLPWMIAAIAWSVGGKNTRWQAKYQRDPQLGWLGDAGFREQAFVVKAGSLAFSVTVFTICAGCCLVLLAVRRRLFGGELGGPKVAKWVSAGVLVCMWFVYIGLSSFQALEQAAGAGGHCS